MHAYRSLGTRADALAVTEDVASRTLTLPLWSGMGVERVERVVQAMRRSRTLAGRDPDASGEVS
jgi:dTDP-4-amino-4,6-dideoxygalactose transaminase